MADTGITPGADSGLPDDVGEHDVDEQDKSLLDKLRDSPVGTNDPNVIGDAGPTDVPPGTDGDVDPGLVGNPPPGETG